VTNLDQAGSLLDRPRFYYIIDGMAELGGSVMCLGYALLLWLQIRSSANSVWHRTLMTYGPILLISGGISLWLYVHHTQAPAQEGR
jgi:hypothetical protein